MKLSELQAKMPELKCRVSTYLKLNDIPYSEPLFGEATIDEENANLAMNIYYTEYAKKQEQERIAQEQAQIEEKEKERIAQEQERIAQEQAQIEKEEEVKKKKAIAQMLVTSGFNFDGYRITKYSGYISGDDAISVDRGVAILGFGGAGARDNLMASLATIRRNALRELKEAAYNLGCNAVIGVDFDYITLDPQTHNIGGGITLQPYVFGVTANGNAVIIEKIEE